LKNERTGRATIRYYYPSVAWQCAFSHEMGAYVSWFGTWEWASSHGLVYNLIIELWCPAGINPFLM